MLACDEIPLVHLLPVGIIIPYIIQVFTDFLFRLHMPVSFLLRDFIIPPEAPLFKEQNRPDFATFVAKTETNRYKTATNRNF